MPTASQHHSFKYQLHRTIKPTIAPLSAAIGGVLAAGSVQAATITVTTLQDGFIGPECSLRSVLYSATRDTEFDACTAGDPGEDTVVFAPALTGSIDLQAGVGLYYDGSTLPIGDSVTVDGDNRITVTGTGDSPVFYAQYDGGLFQTDVVRFNNLTITGGGGAQGGGIKSRSRQLWLNNTVVSGNTANVAGGGIWQEHPPTGVGRLYLFDSTISGNQAFGDNASAGGGIYQTGPSGAFNAQNSVFSNNLSSGSGGAVERRVDTGTFWFYDSELQNNQAKYGDGGAVRSVSSAPGYGTSFFARNSDFRDNSAAGNGGAIFLSDLGTGTNGFGSFVLEGTTVFGNDAGNNGGGVFLVRGDGSGTAGSPNNEVEFRENTFTGQRTLISDNEATYSAGGMYVIVGDATPVYLTGTDVAYNRAADGNGGGAIVIAGNAGIGMENTRFEGNLIQAGGAGGGLFADLDAGDVSASQVSFINNSAVGGAGGARIDTAGGDISIGDSEFIANGSGGYGGGLQVYGTPAQFAVGYSIFRSNTSGNGGGGLDFFTPSASTGIFQIKYSEFSDNEADGVGGAMNLIAGGGSFIVENSTISTNSSSDQGGGIYAANNAELQIKYSTIANNYAQTEGGGVFTGLGGGCQVDNSLLSANTATGDLFTQDLRVDAASSPCNVNHSLLAGGFNEFTDGSGNILGQDPLIGPLADNGGSGGRTHSLLEGSPAIDAGNEGASVPDFDQRGSGFVRIAGATIDIGAFERQILIDDIFRDRFETP